MQNAVPCFIDFRKTVSVVRLNVMAYTRNTLYYYLYLEIVIFWYNGGVRTDQFLNKLNRISEKKNSIMRTIEIARVHSHRREDVNKQKISIFWLNFTFPGYRGLLISEKCLTGRTE